MGSVSCAYSIALQFVTSMVHMFSFFCRQTIVYDVSNNSAATRGASSSFYMGRSIIVLSIDFLSEFFCLKQVFVLGLVNHKMVGLIYVVILKFKKKCGPPA